MTAKILPKTIYVARQTADRGGESWLSAETDITELGQINETVVVGRYELVEVSSLNGVPLISSTRKVKR